MSICVSDIFRVLTGWAPLNYALEFDNPGHLVGDMSQSVSRVLIALDATSEVISEAEAMGAQLVVTHHPLIFDKLGAVVSSDPVGGRVLRLAKSGISLICLHTNLDAACGGVNDVLAKAIGLKNTRVLDVLGVEEDTEYGIGRVGELSEAMPVDKFLASVKESLDANGLRYVAGKKEIKKVAVGGGSCSSYLSKVHRLGCDAFVTADVKHDGFLSAREYGITLIDAGHFSTENLICLVIEEYVQQEFPELEVRVAGANRQPEQFYTGE